MSQGDAQFMLFTVGVLVCGLGPMAPVDPWPRYARPAIVAVGVLCMMPGLWRVFRTAWGF